MRQLFVFALLAAVSLPLAAQQQNAPQGNKPEQPAAKAQQKGKPSASARAEEERVRAEGSAGGTRPVPKEEREAVGAGAGPHRRAQLPPPTRLPSNEPVEPGE
jgi:hypothetical protein